MIPGVKVMFESQANSVFLQMAPEALDALRALGWHFYTFIGSGGARFMCSWDTKTEEVAALVRDLRTVAATK
jgi:threonine aldolase